MLYGKSLNTYLIAGDKAIEVMDCVFYFQSAGLLSHCAGCSAGAPGMDGLKILTPEEQKRHDKARKDFLVEQALQHEDHDTEPQVEDLEDLVEAYRCTFHTTPV